jgi:hypothetical protein
MNIVSEIFSLNILLCDIEILALCNGRISLDKFNKLE